MSAPAFSVDFDGYLTDDRNRRVPRIPAAEFIPPPIVIHDDEQVRPLSCAEPTCGRPITRGHRCPGCLPAWILAQKRASYHTHKHKHARRKSA